MKKIIFILLFSMMMITAVSAVETTNWKNITVHGQTFKIPPKYDGGKINANSYQIGNWNNFAILCIDDYIEDNYGFEADNYGSGEDLEINGHPARYFCGYNTYEKTNLSRIYFSVAESIYCISWQSNNLTEDVKEIIATSDTSEISDEYFYEILDTTLEDYLEQETNENEYYPSYSTTTEKSHDGGSNLINYYLFYKLGQYSRR